MVDVLRQLELNLEVAIDEANEVPEQADLISIWTLFEDDLAGLPRREHLRVAGDILMQLAGLCETKADLLWEDWQDAHNADGPVMSSDWLQGMTRQTQELDFSDLVQRSYRTGESTQVEESDESLIGAAEKTAVLEMLDALGDEDLKAQAMAVSHSENVSDWVKALSARQSDVPQRLVDIQVQLKMPMVEVWLAALLGGFSLEQRGSFYETHEVWVGAGQ
ncbi:MAG: hypothetical protein AAGC93_31985 [Cyanobacteria bacterium P01_F01_bin.53]